MSHLIASLSVGHHKQNKRASPLRPVWIVTRGWGHPGYAWFAVTDDCELLDEACVRENYRQVVRSTLDKQNDGWRVVGVTNSGEMEEPATCAHCGRDLNPED